MKVLIVGRGGREHALAWKLKESPLVKEIFIAPGNAGTANLGRNLPFQEDDLDRLTGWAMEEKVDLVVVGPEKPLVAGITDHFSQNGLLVFGPTQKAAMLEGSKVFAKKIMEEKSVPTAKYKLVSSLAEVEACLERWVGPVVVKADGLAAGKGVLICEDPGEARVAARLILKEGRFGKAGSCLVLEEFLEGREASLFALCDGEDFIIMAPSRDHKQVGEGGMGPNTGGMGAYSPVGDLTPALLEEARQQVFKPVLKAMKERGTPYRGILYAGLIITAQGLKVLEFNARFGDPETQAVLPRLKTDLVPLLVQAAQGKLTQKELEWRPEAALCVVLCSGGYPDSYKKGFTINGLDKVQGVCVFHAGTRLNGDTLLTNGGRVLGITGLGSDLKQARELTYGEIEKISFSDMYYRTDLGLKE